MPMRSHKKYTILAISFVLFIVLLLHFLGLLTSVENFFRSLIIPTSKSVYEISLSIGDGQEKFSSPTELEIAYKNLKEKYTTRQIDAVEFEKLKIDNESLREQLSFISASSSYHSVGGEVIGKNIDPLGSTLVLRVFPEFGVEVDDPVIVDNGILIGTVSRVDYGIVTVRLIDDNSSKIAATVVNKEYTVGVIEGGYGLSIRMNFIPQNEVIEVGNLVVTSGMEISIPYGLLIGTVESVEKEPYQPFQSAIITPVKLLSHIRLVSIII